MMRDTVVLVVELIALFFGVAFGIQIFQRRVGGDRLQNWLGGSPVVAALKGIAIGFVTPFCTFSAVPMLVGFRQANARTAGYVAFIVAAPVLDPVLFGALILIVGVTAALIYLALAFVAAMALALVADAVGIEAHLRPLAGLTGSSASECSTNANEEFPWRGLVIEARNAARSATGLLRSVALVLAVGVALGIAIEAFVSPETTATLTGGNSLMSIPVAAILGTPLYFSTALFVPIADSLTAAGVGIGAIVALTISGAGASLPEFLLLTKLADKKILSVFFVYVLAVALTGGLLAEAIVG